MSAVDLESLMALTPGDVVEVPSLMAGLSSEATLLQVALKEPDCLTFRITYFGVVLGKRYLTRKEGALVWTSPTA